MFLRKRMLLKLVAFYLARKRKTLWRGAVAGAVGGLAGAGIMQLGQVALARRNGGGSPQEVREQNMEEDPASKLVTTVARKVVHHEPASITKKVGGSLVHYAFGSGVGAMYGAVSELLPAARYARGAPFGAALWAAADLAAVPAFRLSSPPQRIPLKQHAQMLGMHVAYGLTTDTVRRYMREVL